MKRKLTYRQQEFLSEFLDAYREMKNPMHYTVIAERTGVNKITAYEMLRTLEEHGLVRAEYDETVNQHGPGRPSVLFYPTAEAERLLNDLAGTSTHLDDWLVEKEIILSKLREGKANGYEDLLNSLLARIPERKTPLIFVTELVTSVILTLNMIKDAPEIKAINERLLKIGLPQEISLGIFSGVGVFLSVLEKANRNSTNFLLTQISRYEESLAQLNDESRKRISEFVREAVIIVTS